MKKVVGGWIGLVLVAVGLFALIAVVDSDVEDRPRVSRVELDIEVRASASELVVVNNNDFDWTDARIVMNDRYTLHVGRIGAGREVAFPLRDFADKDGTRYDPFTVKAVKFNMVTDTPHGFRSYIGRW